MAKEESLVAVVPERRAGKKAIISI